MTVQKAFPLVSILTPAYNRASYLDETIRSVLNQNYTNLDYIVLDDGSTDNTMEVIRKYEATVRYVSHENMGETRTVNKGFAMAQGEIIGIVNSDDPLLPGAIAAAVDLMTRRPEVVVVYPDWYVIDSAGRKVDVRTTAEYSYKKMVRWHDCLPGPGAFFRKALVEQIGGRDAQFRYVADFDFFLRAGLVGPFARIPRTLATFRWHDGGASTKNKGIRMAEEHLRLVDKFFAIPALPREVADLRLEAYSHAYYAAAVSLGDSNLDLKRRYFLRSIRLFPAGFILRYPHKLVEPLVLLLLGSKAYSSIKGLYRIVDRKRQEKLIKRMN